MNHQEILDSCLIPGRALLHGRGDDIAVWALLCAIACQTTGFRTLPGNGYAKSWFFLPQRDLKGFLSNRKHELEPIEKILHFKPKCMMDLNRLCQYNPGAAAALGYLNIRYFLPVVPGQHEWEETWGCFRRMLPKNAIRWKRYWGPTEWVVSHGTGWRLAKRLFDHEDLQSR